MADGKKPKLEWPLARRLLQYVNLRWVAAAVFLSLLVGATTQAFPYLQRVAVDRYLTPAEGSTFAAASLEARLDGISTVAWIYLVIAVVAFAAQFLFAHLVVWIGQTALDRIRTELFAKFQRLPIAYFDSNPVGRLVTRIIGDVEGIGRFVTTGLVSVAQAGFMLTAIAVYMLYLDWKLALIALTMVPVLFVLVRAFTFRLRMLQGRLREREAARNSAFQELISGIGTVQLHNRAEAANAELSHLNRRWLEGDVLALRWMSFLLPTVDLITSVGLAVILWYASGQVLQNALSLGVLIAFTQYLRNFFVPLQDLSQGLQTLPGALASAENIFKVLDEPETVADSKDAKPVGKLRGEVQLNDVWFSYKPKPSDAEWTVRGISLSAKQGESIAIVGATGAGKTTILSLLARFYDPQRGEVKVDGLDVRLYPQRELRRRIGLVLQDPMLFTGTIEANLRMGDDSLPLDRLIEVCKAVGVHDFVASLPAGYQTEVKERGATFSTGQKQLLAFARALVRDPEILILDEATASVDTASEEKVQAALKTLMRGRTSFIVAHRLSTVRHCDKVVVMKLGQIVEQGAPAELLNAGGYYARLHALQTAAAVA